MSATVSIAPATPSKLATSPSSSGVGTPLIGQGGIIFASLLNAENLNTPESGLENNMRGVLVLNNPEGKFSPVAFLSSEQSQFAGDLKSLLAQFINKAESTLPDDVLDALTPGTPHPPEFIKFHNTQTLPPTGSLQASADMTADNNVLLMATDLTPLTMDELKLALEQAATKLTTIETTTEAVENTDLVSTDNLLNPLILVVFQTAPTANQANIGMPVNDADILSLVNSGLGKYISPFAKDSSNTNTVPHSADMTEGFQGSLGDKIADNNSTIKISTHDVKGALPAPIFANLPDVWLNDMAWSDNAPLPNNVGLAGHPQAATMNPLLSHQSAIASHPTIQAVAVMIEKMTTGSDKAKQELSVQLDPPELGRMQIQLSLEKGDTMKVHLIAEKQDTLTLLQRDSHALREALDSAGIKLDGSSLSFDLAKDNQSFNQLMGGFSQDQKSSGQKANFYLDSASGQAIQAEDMMFYDSQIDFYKDIQSGRIRYSLMA
jgi:flagellar hook-length control protein FliK